MKVLHIISSISKLAGGPARSVQGLVAGLEEVGVEAWLMPLKERGLPWVSGIPHFRCPGLEGARGVRRAVESAIDEIQPDLVHVHSIWQLSLHQAVVAARGKNIPYIIAPRGSIEVWSLRQKWLKKKLGLWLYQGRDLKRAVAIHVTAESEAEQARKLGLKQRLILSSNGVNVPDSLPAWRQHEDGFHRAVFVSRIHYKKGLLNLVDAWARVRPQGWKMEIVGTDEVGYQRTVEDRVAKYGLQDAFVFTGPLDDSRKWGAYRRADFFFLPTHSENFGIVVAEALYAGLPVVTTKGTPWRELQERNCGLWIDVSVDACEKALKEMCSLSDAERIAMGCRGRELVEERYLWPAIGRQMADEYQKLIGG